MTRHLSLSILTLLGFFAFVALPSADAQIANPPRLSLALQMSGFNNPVHITHANDGSGRTFVVEQLGRIKILRNGALLTIPFLDITDRVLFAGEQGLLSVAFPPQFAVKNYFYVYYTNRNGDNILARYFLSLDPNVADPASEVILITFLHPVFGNHNGGQLAFGPDGFLYIATGDGGDANDLAGNAQNPGTLLGKMLRIDVESVLNPRVDTYVIPPTNPFIGNPLFRPEIWALGLRNPFRFSFDRLAGDLYIGDVGQNLFEEIDFQPAASPGGENYGWNIMEGLHCFTDPNCITAGLTLPIAEYGHALGCSVTGGHVYRGTDYPRMQGIYFYGDFCTGRIWGLRNDGIVWQNSLLLTSPHSISSFGEDQAGNLYLAAYSTGGIHILADQVFSDVPFTHFAHRHINSLFNNSITDGCLADNPATPENEALYCPNDSTTREQMAAFIVRAVDGVEPTLCNGNRFSDVTAANPFCAHIERLAALGVTLGFSDGTFRPLDIVPREQMAAFLVRAVDAAEPVLCNGNQFLDVGGTNVFCPHIERLASLGFARGYPDGTFKPRVSVTRAEMAIFLGRTFLRLF